MRRSNEQLDAARAQAYRRAEEMARVRNREVSLRKVLLAPPGPLLSVSIHKVLEAYPFMGARRTRKVLEASNVWPLTALMYLKRREVQAILTNLPERVQ